MTIFKGKDRPKRPREEAPKVIHLHPFWVNLGSFLVGGRTPGHPETEHCRPKWIPEWFRWILRRFLGGLGALRELRFQTWRTPRPPERRKKCTKRGFRGTMDACESFVRNTPCPEGWFCNENIVNMYVFVRFYFFSFFINWMTFFLFLLRFWSTFGELWSTGCCIVYSWGCAWKSLIFEGSPERPQNWEDVVGWRSNGTLGGTVTSH